MTERWEHRLRDLHVETPPDMWPRVQQGPRNEPPIGLPPRRERVAAAVVALAVFVVAVVFAWQAFRPTAAPVGSSSTSPPPGMRVYSDPLGWTAVYPSDWRVTPVRRTTDGLGAGVTIANHGAVEETGPIEDYVILTITHPIDATPDPSGGSSSFPLSASDFKVSPGPSGASGLAFRIDGVPYFARLVVGGAAPKADIAAMDQVIASIRPPSSTASPPSPTVGPFVVALSYGGGSRLAWTSGTTTSPTWLTGTKTSLADPFPARDVATSADGSHLAFVGFNSIAGTSSIYVGPADSNAWVPLPGTEGGEHPSWSPDGRQLTFFGLSGRIFIINADGTVLRHIANGIDPSWSPTGGTIAFARVGGGISLLDVRTHRVVNVTDGPDREPAFSASGSELAFVRQEGNGSRVFVMATHGGGAQPLVSCSAGDCGLQTWPIWDPTRSAVAYASDGGITEVSTTGALIGHVSFDPRTVSSFGWSVPLLNSAPSS